LCKILKLFGEYVIALPWFISSRACGRCRRQKKNYIHITFIPYNCKKFTLLLFNFSLHLLHELHLICTLFYFHLFVVTKRLRIVLNNNEMPFCLMHICIYKVYSLCYFIFIYRIMIHRINIISDFIIFLLQNIFFI
jgi:hypothetical protein